MGLGISSNSASEAWQHPARARAVGPQCNFTEGSYIDYRHFDAKDISPRYEFGFGLTYTTFRYTDLAIRSAKSHSDFKPSRHPYSIWDTAVRVQATLHNSGSTAGAEVAQLYLAIPNSPPKQLRGFEKVKLLPRKSAHLDFELMWRDLSIWDVVAQDWKVQEGQYPVMVGASSRDIRLTESFKIPHF
ncbi:fibronectin type III-like domain-containing protein [Aspergillus spectabilis]